MTTMPARPRLLLALVIVALLAACGRSHVIREPGSGAGQRTSARGDGPVRVSQPKYGATVIVQRGQNLYRIATDNGISALDLATWNDIPPPYTIHPGQRLRLYPGGQTGRPVNRPVASTPASRPAAPVVEPPRSAFAWRWPTAGQVIGEFRNGDPTRQGLDIAGQGGQAVNAAAAGTVVYSGSGLVGYGELVIVKHDEKWVSVYGHNRARLVNEGQRVGAGERIAEMGRSGAARDMLHFEIRYEGKPVDPRRYLPAR